MASNPNCSICYFGTRGFLAPFFASGIDGELRPIDPAEFDAIRSSAELMATNILEEYWDNDFPVDVFDIARRMGLDVRYGRTKSDVEGMIIKPSGDQKPVIYIDRNTSWERQRFTVAHEIGHYLEVLRKKQDANLPFRYEDQVLPQRVSLVSDSSLYFCVPTVSGGPDMRRSELFADAVAHSLLMPGIALESITGIGLTLDAAAKYFGVSYFSLDNRMTELNVNI